MSRQFSSAHTLRGPTAERKKSKTNWKNLMKEPNPAKQQKAELKRERRRKRNIKLTFKKVVTSGTTENPGQVLLIRR